ncbi:MAG: Spy/CpxP family protein refolding chaperone [Thermodesulfobacteriota bacterium]
METIGRKARKALGVLALLSLVPVSGWAFGGPGRFQGPPQEAFDACKGKKAGDEVRFTTPRGDNMSAICREFDGKLAAAPERGRGGWYGRGPGRGDGDSCWEGRGRGRGMGMGMGMGMGPGRHFDRIADDLDLTAEQQKQARAILDAERDKSEALRKQMRDSREKMREIAWKSPLDEAAIRKLTDEQAKAKAEMIVSKAQARDKVYALLTPEQKEKAGKRGLLGGGFGPGRGRGFGPGCGPGCEDCPRR